jgi:hypothetical protein
MKFCHHFRDVRVLTQSNFSVDSISNYSYICKTENQLKTTKAGFRRSVSSVVSVSVSAEWNEKTSVNRQQSNDQFLIALKNFLKSSSNISIFLHTALSSVLIVLKKTRVSSRTTIRTFLCFVLFLMLMFLQQILWLMSLMSLMSIWTTILFTEFLKNLHLLKSLEIAQTMLSLSVTKFIWLLWTMYLSFVFWTMYLFTLRDYSIIA